MAVDRTKRLAVLTPQLRPRGVAMCGKKIKGDVDRSGVIQGKGKMMKMYLKGTLW